MTTKRTSLSGRLESLLINDNREDDSDNKGKGEDDNDNKGKMPQPSPRFLPINSAPVLRWWSNVNGSNRSLPTLSPSRMSFSTSSTRPASPDALKNNFASRPASPPDMNIKLLHEALQETLPCLPPPARLPSSFYASNALSRPHPFLVDNLTRSTLPTASLTNYNDQPLKFSPTKSSVETLRSLHRRSWSVTSKSASMDMTIPPSPPASSGWWWFQNSDNKTQVDSMLDKEDQAETIEDEQENLRNKYHSPKNPVVFCAGLLGFDTVSLGPIAPVTYWRGVKEVLEANGTEIFITRVPATSSPVERAKVLEQKISEKYPGRSVHLIGHSMGGLDCRYLTTHLKNRKFSVLSVTTIATPHRGSTFANHFLETIGQTRMPSVLQLIDMLPIGGGDGTAFAALTPESMAQFNLDTPDVPGVAYFSWGAYYEPGKLIDTWKWPHSVILEREGPNDGLVSVESSKWGTYLGTVENVSHLDLVGWINPARYKWASLFGKEIKFRPLSFYLGIVSMLADDVEGEANDGEHPNRGELSIQKLGLAEMLAREVRDKRNNEPPNDTQTGVNTDNTYTGLPTASKSSEAKRT